MESEITQKFYKETLEQDIERGNLATKFLQSEFWSLIKAEIEQALPKTSPYALDTLGEIKEQGAYIKGLLFIENLLNDLIDKAQKAKVELEHPEQ